MIRFIVFLLIFSAPLFARDPRENKRIEALLGHVESLEEARFIRNGKAYDCDKAADHLRMKLRRAGERVKTAEQFIDGLATKSSFSGKPYRIRFADGSESESGPYFHRRLDSIDDAEG